MDDQNQNPKVQSLQDPQVATPPIVETQQPQSHKEILQPSHAFTQEMQGATSNNDTTRQDIATPQPIRPSSNSIYPDISENATTPSVDTTPSLVNIHGQLGPITDRRTPIGIYVIAGFLLIGLLIGFQTTGADAILLDGLLFINVILAFGLIAKKNIFRQIMVVLTVIVIISTGLNIILLPAQEDVSQRDLNIAQTALNQLKNSSTNISPQDLSSMQAKVNSTQTIINQDKQRNARGYITYSATIIIYIGLIIYLTRPRVKAVFT